MDEIVVTTIEVTTGLLARTHRLVHTLVFPGSVPGTPGNAPPVAQDDAAAVAQGQQVTVAVLANDTDPDGDPLTVTHVNGVALEGGAVVSIAHGTVVLVDAALLFEPDPTYAGPVSFTYTVSDGRGGTDTAAVAITVTPATGGPSTEFDALYAPEFRLDAGGDARPQPPVSYPAKSASILEGGYLDPEFGTWVRRTTDVADVPDSVASLRHEYSRRQAFNCDSTRFLAQASNGFWHLFDAQTLQRIPGGRTLTPGNGAVLGLAGDCEPIWHPTDPDRLWYTTTNGGLVWWERNVATGTTEVAFDLGPLIAEQTTITNAAGTWWKGEGRPSNDGRWWALMVDDAAHNIRGLIMYDREQHAIAGYKVLTSNRPDHISTSPLGLYAVVSWYGAAAPSLAEEAARPIEQAGGVRAYTRNFASFQTLSVLGEHSDVALDADGRECFVAISYHGQADGVVDGSVYCRPIADPDAAFSTAINVYGGSTGEGIHISGTATRRPGWVVVSKYAGVGSGAYDGQVVLAELVAGGRVRRLAHHRSAVNGYWAEPHASASPDLTRVVFSTDWGEDRPVCDMQIVLPSWAVPGAAVPEAPANLTAPAVTPSPATTEDTLTCTSGNWSGFPAPSIAYQWTRDGADVGGAAAATYHPTAAGEHRCRVTATNASGSASALSNAVAVTVVESEPPPANVLAFSGEADGTLLSALPPGWSANAANYAVAGGALRANGGGYSEGLAYMSEPRGADQTLQVTRRAAVTDGYAELLLHIHARAEGGGYVAKLQHTNIQLYRDDQYQGQAAHGVDLDTQDVTIRLANFGGRVRVYLDGSAVPLLEFVDEAPITDGAQGVNIYSNGNTARHQIAELRYS